MNMTASLTESYNKGATDVPLIEQPIGTFFDDMVEKQPDREALVSRHEGQRYTYRELQAESNKLASALLDLGLPTGDRVGIWSHNNVPWVLMQIATAKVGLILVNINPAYRTSELEYALNKVGCKVLVTMAQFKTSDYLGMLRELGPQRLPQLLHTFWIDKPGQGDEQPGMRRFSQLLAGGDAADARIARIQKTLKATDPINIQFTSGTTGFPKGATLTHRNILNNGFFIGECMKLSPVDRLCIPVPLYHCFGMVLGNLACLTHGSTIVYPNDGFDPLTVLETGAGRKMHRPARRAHHVHRRARPPALQGVRPVDPAHRHHGRLAMPHRGHEARGQRNAPERNHHRLRHDRNQPRELPRAAPTRRWTGACRPWARCSRTWR